MPKRINRYVVVFDICTLDSTSFEINYSIKRRTALWRILFEFGYRTQLSVFEVEVPPHKFDYFIRRIKRVMRKETDKVYIYPLDEKSHKNVVRVGKFTLLKDYGVF
jgi:CRISPR-associated endonuclease Cas2